MEKGFLEGLDLGGGAKLSEEAVAAILAEQEREAEAHKNAVASLTTERDGLKAQLIAAEGEIRSYKDLDIDEIRRKAEEWETKYDTDTQALKEQLEAATYGFAVKEATADYRFTSESARKAFLADLEAKKLPLQEGKLLGLEDFRKAYQESDPGAFVPEGDGKILVAARGGTGGTVTMGQDAAMRAAMGLPELKG